jgi:hypothetical protein
LSTLVAATIIVYLAVASEWMLLSRKSTSDLTPLFQLSDSMLQYTFDIKDRSERKIRNK